jgi:nucleotide-binding universal stress UspA family protein
VDISEHKCPGEGAQRVFRHILIAFDGSASSRKALDAALGLAQAFGATLSLVSVEEYIPYFPADIGEVKEEKERQNEYYSRLQREAREAAKLKGMDLERVDILMGHVAQRIVNHAEAIPCDLIVLGHSGRSGVWANFLGTTVERVSRHAHCSVIIIR